MCHKVLLNVEIIITIMAFSDKFLAFQPHETWTPTSIDLKLP